MGSPIHLVPGTAERLPTVEGFDHPGVALTIDGFVTRSIAGLMVALHRENRHLCPSHGPACDHFDGRILYAQHLPGSNTRDVAYQTASRISRAIERHLSGGRRVHDDGPQLALWPVGYGMPVHEDQQPTVEHRAFAGLLYLNDEYTGGETVFPSLGVKLRPRTGRLVIYTGRVPHGTCDVLSGERYTMPSFHQYHG